MFKSLLLFFNLGPGEIVVIALVILLIFGGKWLCFVNSISFIIPCKYISFN